jgi:ribose transport system permease protein
MITVRGRVPSFITTLGMLMIARGAAHVWSGGQTIYLPTPALAVNLLPLGSALVVILIAAAMLNGSRLGRSIYAVGGNAEAAYLSGIPTNRIITLAFTMSGILAGLAAILPGTATSYMPLRRLSSGEPASRADAAKSAAPFWAP